jgi:methylisocitrate lyase
MVEWGKTPIMSPAELHQRGFDLIVYPVAAILAQAKAVGEVFATLRREGSTASIMDRLVSFDEFNSLMELERHRAAEQRAAAAPPAASKRDRAAPPPPRLRAGRPGRARR